MRRFNNSQFKPSVCHTEPIKNTLLHRWEYFAQKYAFAYNIRFDLIDNIIFT